MASHTHERSEFPFHPMFRSFLHSVADPSVADSVSPRPEPVSYPPFQVVQPSIETPPSNVMDILVEKYTRFSYLIARNRVEREDLAELRAVCIQVEASALEMEAEARRRRRLIKYIEACIDLLSTST